MLILVESSKWEMTIPDNKFRDIDTNFRLPDATEDRVKTYLDLFFKSCEKSQSSGMLVTFRNHSVQGVKAKIHTSSIVFQLK